MPGYEGSYQASNLGRVRSVDREIQHPIGGSRKVRGVILSPSRGTAGGHLQVRLHANGHKSGASVHRLVLLAFVGQPEDGEVCRHLNGNPEDNRLENLAWGTRSENGQDMVRHGRSMRWPRSPVATLTPDRVKLIRERYSNGERQSDIAEEFGLCQPTVSRIVNGQRWAWLDAEAS